VLPYSAVIEEAADDLEGITDPRVTLFVFGCIAVYRASPRLSGIATLVGGDARYETTPVITKVHAPPH